MGKRGKDLTPSIKQAVLRLSNEGYSSGKIGELLGINRFTVYKCTRRAANLENIENFAGSERVGKCGRKRKTKPRTDRQLLKVVKTNRRKSLIEITHEFNKSTPNKLSKRTVQRRLHFHGYYRRVVKKTTTIPDRNRKKRRAFCRSHIKWTVQQNWSKVIFSDETQVVIGADKKAYVWRTNEEKWKPRCLGVYSDKTRPRLSVMFWGCITYDGVGTLAPVNGTINSAKYIELLDTHLWPVIAKFAPGRPYIFQEDNAPVHTSRETTRWKQDNNIPGMFWPPQSPDCNIIENVWRTVKVKLQKRVTEIKSKQDLIDCVMDIWASLTPAYVKSLYESLPKRMRAVLAANGCITKY